MIELRSVPFSDVDDVWHLMEGYVEEAVKYSSGTLTANSIREAIKERDMQAMVAVEGKEVYGVMITSIHNATSGINYLHVVALAGDRFTEWRNDANELLKSWAHTFNAPFISLNGRRGWVKRLGDLGWKEDTVVMKLDLRS